MSKCISCGKTLRWSWSGTSCDYEGCELKECDDCSGKVSSKLKECKGVLCPSHINNHNCRESSTEEVSDNDEPILYSKSKKSASLDSSILELKDTLESIDKLYSEGYTYLYTIGDYDIFREED